MIIKRSRRTQKKIFLKSTPKKISTIALILGTIFVVAFSFAISPNKDMVTSLIQDVKAIAYHQPEVKKPYKIGDGNRFGIGFREDTPDISGFNRLNIEIKHKNWESLKIQRKQSLSATGRGYIVYYKDNYVPAKIRFNGDLYKVKLRFKGMTTGHIKQEKWSYRIIVKGKKTILGMKQFSIQHPSQRSWMYESVINLAMKREGLLGLRYKFIYVSINGRNMGLYALEEHFEKRLIENNQRPNGPILKFKKGIFKIFDSAKSGVINKDPVLYQQYQKASDLLRALNKGYLTVDEVFDVKKLAMYCAIIDLFGAHHAAHWSSLRMYYNPIISKMEIIYYDGNALGVFDYLIGAGRNFFQQPGNPAIHFFKVVFDDPAFYKEYVAAIEKVSKKQYLDNLLADLMNKIKRDETLLASEWINYSFSKKWYFQPEPNPENSSLRWLYKNQKKMRLLISGRGTQPLPRKVVPVKEVIHAHYQKDDENRIALGLLNDSPLPIEILGIQFRNSLQKPSKAVLLPARYPTGHGLGNVNHGVSHASMKDERPVRLVYFSKPDLQEANISSLKLRYKVMGSTVVRETGIHPLPIKGRTVINGDPLVKKVSSETYANHIFSEKNNLSDYEFLDINHSTKEISLRKEVLKITRNLVIPKGHKLTADPGVRVGLNKGANILSYSPVSFLGSEEAPVIIHSLEAYASSENYVRDLMREKSELDDFEFLDINNSTKEIIMRKGMWELSRNLIIPKGYKLKAQPGVRVDLSKNASILSYSPVSFLGNEDDPIIIHSSENYVRDIIREKSKLDDYEFLVVNNSTKEITLQKGAWELSRNLVIPQGYKLIAGPGVQIDLKKGATLLSYSPVSFLGNEEDPIIIHSSDGDGGGLAVLSADGWSDLRHVVFKGLSAPSSDRWELTGTVTFYESNVRVANSQFLGGKSEDALHVVRSKVNIADTHFENSHSDAFDGDFVEAKINDSTFLKSGNDAVDISGSSLIMKNSQMNQVGDKGLSAGENSRASLTNIKIKSSYIGLSSKDLSNVLVNNVSIEDSKVGIAAYQKKSEFGPAEIMVSAFRSKGLGLSFMLEEKSTLVIDGDAKSPNQKKVYRELYSKKN